MMLLNVFRKNWPNFHKNENVAVTVNVVAEE